jgi:hypothetical protein
MHRIKCGELRTQTKLSNKTYMDPRIGWGEWSSLVSGVADVANSELLNAGEASKPNGTPSSASYPPLNLSLTKLALHHSYPAFELLALNTRVGIWRGDERIGEGDFGSVICI